MLQELFEYIRTPSSEQARNFGYLKELIGLKSRVNRNRQAWQPHFDECHKLVKAFCEAHPQARSMTLFGSGYLYEMPMDYLLQRMQKIVLVDIVFPRQIKQLAAKNPRIKLIEHDLSGSLHAMQIGRLSLKSPFFEYDTDLVISANVLSQLPILPLQWIEKRKICDSDEMYRFGKEIVRNHMRMLKLMAYKKTPVLLFTDIERIFRDNEGKQLEVQHSLYDLPLGGVALGEWEWQIAPLPEISKDFSMSMRVSAVSY